MTVYQIYLMRNAYICLIFFYSFWYKCILLIMYWFFKHFFYILMYMMIKKIKLINKFQKLWLRKLLHVQFRLERFWSSSADSSGAKTGPFCRSLPSTVYRSTAGRLLVRIHVRYSPTCEQPIASTLIIRRH